MSDAVQVALIVALGPILATIVTHWLAARKIAAVAAHVVKVEHATNGLTKALGDTKLAQGIAEGTATGLQQGRDEKAAEP